MHFVHSWSRAYAEYTFVNILDGTGASWLSSLYLPLSSWMSSEWSGCDIVEISVSSWNEGRVPTSSTASADKIAAHHSVDVKMSGTLEEHLKKCTHWATMLSSCSAFNRSCLMWRRLAMVVLGPFCLMTVILTWRDVEWTAGWWGIVKLGTRAMGTRGGKNSGEA